MDGVSANAPAAEPQDFTGVETVEFSSASPTSSPHFALVTSANAVYSAGSNDWALGAPGGSVEFKLTLPVLQGVAIILRLSGNATDSPVNVSVNGVNLVENFAPSYPGFANVSWYMSETVSPRLLTREFVWKTTTISYRYSSGSLPFTLQNERGPVVRRLPLGRERQTNVSGAFIVRSNVRT